MYYLAGLFVALSFLASQSSTSRPAAGDQAAEVERQTVVQAPSASSRDLDVSLLKKLQETLKTQGFYTGTVDGIVGPLTRRAASRFQRANGLPVTGRLDDQTIQLLEKKIAENPPSPPQHLRVIDVRVE